MVSGQSLFWRRGVPADPSPDVLVALGQAVRALRLERGFSQERLAEESGLHPRYVSDVERGRRNVGMVNVDRLSRALSVDLPTLMARVEAQRPR
jgi:transcriptional regulator with XRE-family HTH domain